MVVSPLKVDDYVYQPIALVAPSLYLEERGCLQLATSSGIVCLRPVPLIVDFSQAAINTVLVLFT